MTNPIQQLKQKARDCGGCAKRREKIKQAWEYLTRPIGQEKHRVEKDRQSR